MPKLTFGKYKGREIDDIAKTKSGREYLAWLVEQPCSDPKWQEQTDNRNNYIRKAMGIYEDARQVTMDQALEQTALDALSFEIIRLKDRVTAIEKQLSPPVDKPVEKPMPEYLQEICDRNSKEPGTVNGKDLDWKNESYIHINNRRDSQG